MIITSKQDLLNLPLNTKLYVAWASKIEVYDSLFTINTSANPKKYYPLHIINKVSELKFEEVTIEKTSYTLKISNVIDDIVEYDDYHTHAYYVTTSERETLQLLNKGMLRLMETIGRATKTIERMYDDFSSSNYMVENKELYPEDWL
jgi:hypothetical protein